MSCASIHEIGRLSGELASRVDLRPLPILERFQAHDFEEAETQGFEDESATAPAFLRGGGKKMHEG